MNTETDLTVITFGTYDLFHIGHVNILKRAAALGQRLVVGVSTDKLNFSKKSTLPTINEVDRSEIIRSLRFVDEVFLEESLELKREYILQYKANVLVMGDDWAGRFDEFSDICKVVYLQRTSGISTTSIKQDLHGARSGIVVTDGV